MLSFFKMPRFLALLFFVEMWERFSYYGMRALLILFLTTQLGFADPKAYAIYSLFAAICYAMPAIGGFLADRFFGFRAMVKIGGYIMVIGHAIMALVDLNSNAVFYGLGLISVATGLFKGNITNLLGACYIKEDPERERGFTWFYVAINMGSLMATLSCGYISQAYGWHYGFALAGIGMFVGQIIFLKYEDLLGQNGLSPNPSFMARKIIFLSPNIWLFLVATILSCFFAILMMDSSLYINIVKFFGFIIIAIYLALIAMYLQRAEYRHARNLTALGIMLVFFTFFFAIEMQIGSLINLFTQRNVVKSIFGIIVPDTFSQSINPFSIIVVGPIIAEVFVKIGPKYSLVRFAIGLLTMAICYSILYFGCAHADPSGMVSPYYLIIGITFMGAGEVCLVPFVQSQATILAPKNVRGFVMGVLWLSLAFANIAGVVIARFVSVPSVAGKVDPIASLEIYKNGFYDIVLFTIFLSMVFILFYVFLDRTINRELKAHKKVTRFMVN